MSKAIQDQFTGLKITRQYRYQLRKAAKNKCVICGRPRSRRSATYCAKHLEAARLRSKQLYRERWKQERKLAKKRKIIA